MKSGFISDFSVRLKEERKRLGLNQTALGEAGGVTKDTQLNYEAGVRAPDAAYLHAVAEAGADVLYLLTGERAPEVNTDGLTAEAQAILHAYQTGSSASKAAFHAVAALAMEAGQSQESQPQGNRVAIGGDVGQAIAGDATFSAPVSFGGVRRKKGS